MGRDARKESPTGMYFVWTQGVGGMAAFTDDEDREKMSRIIGEQVRKHDGELLAWCLTSNEVWLVLRCELAGLVDSMKGIKQTYAQYFNRRHRRAGHLFGDRYKCDHVLTDGHLGEAVRYVHTRPVAAGLSETCDFAWSSYRSYAESQARPEATEDWRPAVSRERVLAEYGGRLAFSRKHELCAQAARHDDEVLERRLEDAAAIAMLDSRLGPGTNERIHEAEKDERNRLLHEAKALPLSNKLLARVTGLSVNIVQRA